MNAWKLLIDDEPQAGAWNMAVDEYLFRMAEKAPGTFLRFYRWDRPTASLGYAQNAAKVIDLKFCRTHGIGVVRRITGGKLVLHDREVTYAVASSDARVFTETLRDSYRLVSRALMRGLELMGLAPVMAEESPPAYVRGTMPCFAYPARDEIEIGGKKIVGSAQKRTGALFLQHGSIPLEKDEGLLARVAAPRTPAEGETGMTSLSEATGRSIDFSEASEYLRRGFADFFGVSLEPYVFSPEDRKAIADLRDRRYASDVWTLRH